VEQLLANHLLQTSYLYKTANLRLNVKARFFRAYAPTAMTATNTVFEHNPRRDEHAWMIMMMMKCKTVCCI